MQCKVRYNRESMNCERQQEQLNEQEKESEKSKDESKRKLQES